VGGPSGAGLGVLWGHAVCREICERGDDPGVLFGFGATLGAIGAFTGGIIGAIGWPSSWSLGVWPGETGRGTTIGVRLTVPL
jgi:hypothetical protein